MPAAYLKGPAEILPSIDIPYWCAGKQPFESAVTARAVAARKGLALLTIYRCRRCGRFHIGNNTRGGPASKAVVAELIRAH